MFVEGVEGEISKDETQLLAERLADFLQRGKRLAAVWTFVVAVLDKCDRRIAGTAGVVAVADGNGELGLVLRKFHGRPALAIDSNAARMPSAPGLISVGDR